MRTEDEQLAEYFDHPTSRRAQAEAQAAAARSARALVPVAAPAVPRPVDLEAAFDHPSSRALARQVAIREGRLVPEGEEAIMSAEELARAVGRLREIEADEREFSHPTSVAMADRAGVTLQEREILLARLEAHKRAKGGW